MVIAPWKMLYLVGDSESPPPTTTAPSLPVSYFWKFCRLSQQGLCPSAPFLLPLPCSVFRSSGPLTPAPRRDPIPPPNLDQPKDFSKGSLGLMNSFSTGSTFPHKSGLILRHLPIFYLE